MIELPPEIAALIDYGPIEAAEAENTAEQLAFEAVAAEARQAEALLSEAKAALPALLRQAVEGGAGSVTDAELVAAHRRVDDAERLVEFRREVARRLSPSQMQMEGRLEMARRKAYAPVLEHSVDLMIEAARLGDESAGSFSRRTEAGKFEMARRAFMAANAVMTYAIRNGATHPNMLYRGGWPTTEVQERERWGRPALAETAA